MIALSAVLAGYEAIRRLLDPAPLQHLGWVAAAGVIGFLGNEWVALYRVRVGRRIGIGGAGRRRAARPRRRLTSLAVVAGAAGVLAGAFRWPTRSSASPSRVPSSWCLVLRPPGRVPAVD